jgi:acyl-coenzyme A synthetase/AMP-(fatty) acid ligase
VVLRPTEPAAADGEQEAGLQTRAAAIRDWVNAKVGKTQRLSDLIVVDALPRGTIGKVLKRELRDSYGRAAEPGPP